MEYHLENGSNISLTLKHLNLIADFDQIMNNFAGFLFLFSGGKLSMALKEKDEET